MNKKRWALVLLLALLIFGYIKLFYKKIDYSAVPKSADYIVALDVKKITNTLIWNVITTPSQWDLSFSKSSTSDTIEWKDLIQIPDYVLVFHVKGQPIGTWYALLEIEDDNDFTKAMQQRQFIQQDSTHYSNAALGISLLKKDKQIIITNIIDASNRNLNDVHKELLVQKSYVSKEIIDKIAKAKSHLAIYLSPNKFLEKDCIATANFDKEKLKINCFFTPNAAFSFEENNFSCAPNSLFNLALSQPPPALYGLMNDSLKNSISKAININIDSLLLPSNRYYQLEITDIMPRVDSAISYTYDDDFNKVEKVVVNNIEEPSFNFTVAGDSASKVYNNWLNNDKMEVTDKGNLFRVIPFAKSYCSLKNASRLDISTSTYAPDASQKKVSAIFYVNLLLTKIPISLIKYLPDAIQNITKNLQYLNIILQKEKDGINLHLVVQKKANNLPLVDL